jgi:hypothetical protein
MSGDFAGAVAGNAGDQEPDVEEFAVGTDAELTVAGLARPEWQWTQWNASRGRRVRRTVEDSTI